MHCVSSGTAVHLAVIELEIQRDTAIIKRGKFRKRVKGFGTLGASKAIKKIRKSMQRPLFFYRTPKMAPRPDGKDTYIFASSPQVYDYLEGHLSLRAMALD